MWSTKPSFWKDFKRKMGMGHNINLLMQQKFPVKSWFCCDGQDLGYVEEILQKRTALNQPGATTKILHPVELKCQVKLECQIKEY
jgi:hypothetical protein